MIQLIMDLISQFMFLSLILTLSFCLAYLGVALILWTLDKISQFLK